MFDLLSATFALPGIWPVLAVTFAAGLVYGFAGFGAALIYMPLATLWLPPPVAVAGLALSATASLVTVVPKALPIIDRRATAEMLGAALVTAPLGIWVLRNADPVPLRWFMAGLVAVTLVALLSGWRYRAAPGLWTRIGVGAATGVVGGATGLTGPTVILFHLGGQDNAATARASTLVFLTILSLCMLPQLALQGLLSGPAVMLGVVQLLPYALGGWLGQAMFDPEREVIYRRTAYGLIALAVILGVPKG